MNPEFTFTVFTCTYNRATTLHRVYESLSEQTFRDFEWIVFDNGSTDNTRELVEHWIKRSAFSIRLLSWPENTGYQNTFNACVAEARGAFFLNLDSDDRCVPEALERLHHLWNRIPETQRDSFSGVTVLCKDQHGVLAGNRFPKEYLVSNAVELEYRYKVHGEKWGFIRMDILREYPFPRVPYHVMPHVVWQQIALKYDTLFVNEVLRIYYSDEAGEAGQLTAVSPRCNAAGKALGQRAILNQNMGWFFIAPWALSKASLQYIRFSLHSGTGLVSAYRALDRGAARTLFLATLPGGIMLFIADKLGELRISKRPPGGEGKAECGPVAK